MSKRIVSMFFATALVATTVLGGARPAEAAIFTSADVLTQSEFFAQDPMFQSVGWIAGSQTQGESFFVAGSAVLIDPYWVLTAGHNLTRLDNSGLDAVLFSLSTSIFDQPPNYAAADLWFPFPGYSGTASPGTNVDLGLIRLADPIFDVIPAQRFNGVDEQDTHMYMAGYGRPGVWPDLGTTFDGVKRAGENIACFSCSVLIQEQYWTAEFDRFSPLPMEWKGSPGDSGGGWFMESGELAGINSFGQGSTISGAIRVSLYNDWIDDVMTSNSPAVVPEPSTWALFLIGIVMMGISRRYLFATTGS